MTFYLVSGVDGAELSLQQRSCSVFFSGLVDTGFGDMKHNLSRNSNTLL